MINSNKKYLGPLDVEMALKKLNLSVNFIQDFRADNIKFMFLEFEDEITGKKITDSLELIKIQNAISEAYPKAIVNEFYVNRQYAPEITHTYIGVSTK